MTSLAQPASEIIQQIRSLPYFAQSIYHDLNIEKTLDFFTRRYVHPLSKKFAISSSTVVDCGAGFGWFSLAYLMAGGKAAIAVDIDNQRLATAEQISTILSLHDRMAFIVSPIQNVPLAPDSVELFVSIETLEHIGGENVHTALQLIKNSTSQGVLITTPNQFFPVVAHDTRLPFLHWLPPRRRTRIARIMGREKMNDGNEFLTPLDLKCLLDKFRPASRCLAMEDYNSYRSLYPLYLPYGPNERQRYHSRLSKLKAAYYWIVSAIFGQYSYWVMPSLAVLFERK